MNAFGFAPANIISWVPIAAKKSARISVNENAVLFITAPNNNTLNHNLTLVHNDPIINKKSKHIYEF